MNKGVSAVPGEIEKKHVTSLISFAQKNVPGVDIPTLNHLQELMNASGSFGVITDTQLVELMHFMLQYIPGTCPNSFLILMELLSIYLPFDPTLPYPALPFVNHRDGDPPPRGCSCASP